MSRLDDLDLFLAGDLPFLPPEPEERAFHALVGETWCTRHGWYTDECARCRGPWWLSA